MYFMGHVHGPLDCHLLHCVAILQTHLVTRARDSHQLIAQLDVAKLVGGVLEVGMLSFMK
jgi:hypothetical protein